MFLAPMLGDCELLYIPFDVLYCSHTARINYPLSERLRVLKETVKPTNVLIPGISGVHARVEPLIPEETHFGGIMASKKASTLEEIKSALEGVKQREEEGILIKALNSLWIPNDRSKHWLKIKPDYLASQEIDAVVLGGWYSTSAARSSAGISQYLMGLVKQPVHEEDQPTSFITFCRVGSGLSDDERRYVNDKLMPLFVADRKAKPSCVIATGSAVSQPDVWVKDPFRSLVFELNADLRMIQSANFASRVSLRFPRIIEIREDKNAATANREDLIVTEAKEKFEAAEMRDAEAAMLGGGKRKRKTGVGQRKRKANLVIEHARKRAEKLATVKTESDLFKGRTIYIFPPPSGYKGDATLKGNVNSWRAAVKKLGGKPSLNNFQSVTDVVAATLDDPRVKKHIQSNPEKSILTPQWILRCEENKRLCPLRPRDFIYMAPSDDRKPSSEEADRFGDYYYQDAEAEDVHALIQRHIKEKEIDVDEIIRSLFAAAAPMLLLDEGSAGGAHAASSHSSIDPANGNSAVFANGVTSLNKLEEYTTAVEQRSSARFSARTLLGWLNSELSAVGKLDFRRSILHGCTLFILEIPVSEGETAAATATGGVKIEEEVEEEANTMVPSFTATKEVEAAAAEAAASARKLRFNRFKLAAQMHGAKVVEKLTPEVSHLVGVITPSVSDKASIAAAAAVVSPDSDTLLTALKNISTDGSKAVRLLHDFLIHDESIQLVSSDWIEEAAVLAAAKAAAEKGSDSGGAPLLIQPPDAAQFPLMDAEMMEDVTSWRWTHYAPALCSDTAGAEGTAKGQRQKQQRGRGRSAAVAGEIIHVPRSTRRGTAIQGGKKGNRRRGTSSQITASAAEESFEGGGGGGDVNSPPIESDFTENEVGSLTDSELEDVPKIKSKPRSTKKTTTKAAAAAAPAAARTRKGEATKEKGARKNAQLPPLPPTSTAAPSVAPEASNPVPTLTAAPVNDDEVLSMRDFFDLMPMDEKELPLTASTAVAEPAPQPLTAVGASIGAGAGSEIGNNHGISSPISEPTLPSSVPPAPSTQPATAGSGASGAGGGGAPKISLKEKIRLVKEANEKMQHTD